VISQKTLKGFTGENPRGEKIGGSVEKG